METERWDDDMQTLDEEYGPGVDPWACTHESVTTPDGNGAYCKYCGETLA